MIYQPYVYHVLDTTNNMYYIGSKTSKNCTPENTKDYFGSPTCSIFRQAIKTRPETLVKTILKTFHTRKEAVLFEIELHKKLNIKDDQNSYNLANQTVTKYETTHSAETKEKMRAAKLNQSAETRAKISKTKTGTKLSAETCKKMSTSKLGNRNKLGKKDSEETRARKSAAQYRRNELKRLQAATG